MEKQWAWPDGVFYAAIYSVVVHKAYQGSFTPRGYDRPMRRGIL